MKALLMAAGKGTRISRYIEGRPKCSVDIGDVKLVEYMIKKLMAYGINEIAMVLGYKYDYLEKILKDYPIKFYYNYFFEVTNSIASTWFAKDFLDDDMVLMNADVYLEDKILDMLFAEKKSPVLFSDEGRKDVADYKLYYEGGELIKYGKELEGKDITGEYVGLARIGKEFLPDFKKRLDELIKAGKCSMWWEDVLYSYVGERPIYVENVEGMFWAEVDYIEDYERILKFRGIDDSVVIKQWLGV